MAGTGYIGTGRLYARALNEVAPCVHELPPSIENPPEPVRSFGTVRDDVRQRHLTNFVLWRGPRNEAAHVADFLGRRRAEPEYPRLAFRRGDLEVQSTAVAIQSGRFAAVTVLAERRFSCRLPMSLPTYRRRISTNRFELPWSSTPPSYATPYGYRPTSDGVGPYGTTL